MKPAEKPASCVGCPAYEQGVGFVPPEGPLDAQICFIGQGPGEIESKFSRPFYPTAPSGKLFEEIVYRAGWQRSKSLVTNLVWCWLPKGYRNGSPYGNRDPEPNEIEFCTQRHLLPLLEDADFLRESDKVLVTLGAPAAEFILETTNVSKFTGTLAQRAVSRRENRRASD